MALRGKAIKRAENIFHLQVAQYHMDKISADFIPGEHVNAFTEIGRASCRERV